MTTVNLGSDGRSHYTFSTAGIAGVAAPNVYLTLFNPANSGEILSWEGAFLSSAANAAVSTTTAMRGYRIAAAPTGGSVQAVSTIAKFSTEQADSVAEVRLGNPTVTLGAALWNTPPSPTSGAGGGSFIHVVDVGPSTGGFKLKPGEGIAIHCALADVDQVWNLTVVWSE